MFEEILQNVAAKAPLVHCITNYVTVNDCANILLACGGSPIMADDENEVEEITSICNALVLNIGTLNTRTIESMRRVGLRANALGHPVVFDPVGAGASALRTGTAQSLLHDVRFCVIRGNSSEIRTLARGAGTTRGVDADAADAATEQTLDDAVSFVKTFSRQTGAVVAMTGAIDLVGDAETCYIIRNGCPEMGKITGTGCMLTAVTAAWCAANPDHPLDAAAAAVAAMGLCGELARARAQAAGGGTGTLRMALIDAMSRLDAETLNRGIRIESR